MDSELDWAWTVLLREALAARELPLRVAQVPRALPRLRPWLPPAAQNCLRRQIHISSIPVMFPRIAMSIDRLTRRMSHSTRLP